MDVIELLRDGGGNVEKGRRDDKKWAGRAWAVEEFYCAGAGWAVWVGIPTRISGCDARGRRAQVAALLQ